MRKKKKRSISNRSTLFETLENSKGWKNSGEMVRVGGEVEWIKGITGRNFLTSFLRLLFHPREDVSRTSARQEAD